MKKITCCLCLGGDKPKEVHDGSLIHAIKNMIDGGKTGLVVCADSPLKPPGFTLAWKPEGTG